jgi:hypothetical protein
MEGNVKEGREEASEGRTRRKEVKEGRKKRTCAFT